MNNKNKKIVLHQVGANKSLLLMILMLFLSAGVYAQGKKLITGTVYDNSGAPLAGATVKEIGTKNATSTDFVGKFILEVASGSTIEVTFMGFTTKTVQVDDNSNAAIIVRLESSINMLDDIKIVSVGYGTMRKSDLTGAISTVSSENLAKGTISSTEQVLQGKVAGLTLVKDSGDPSYGSSIRLRGGTSLTASNNPLIVVDGIAGVDINIVQPSDVKSIDVLKDASATAIYGSRGANGVIIITTKSGVRGVSVTYNGYSGVGNASNHIDMLSANQWRGYVRENNMKDAIDYGANTNWQKELEQTAISHSHTLSISSGNGDSGFRTSLSYLDNQGVIKSTDLKRLSANLNAYQYILNKAVKFDTGLFATIDKYHPLDYRIFERAFNLNPTIPVYDANGNFTSVGGTLYENPVEIQTNRTADNDRNRLLGYFKSEAKIFDDFKAVVNMSMEYNSNKGNTYKPTYAVMEGQTEDGYAQKTYGQYVTGQLDAYLNYTKILGKNNISAMVGYSYFENIYEGFGAQRSGFVTDLFSYNNLGAGYNYRLGDVYSYKGKSNLVSLFARANYSYDSRYMLTATIRKDGSSRFGENNKWGTFPSASAAWKISNEDFMESTKDWLTNLKLRVGYGVTGNQDGIGEYKSLSILGVGHDSYYDPATDSWSLAYSPTQNPNPDLKWETTEQFNIGVDFGLFENLTGSFEWYSKSTKDLLYTYEVPQPPYLVGTMLANVGELSNKGLELTLNAKIMQRKNFTWNANLTFAHNIQKIEKLSNPSYKTDVIYSGSLHGLSGMSNQYSQIIAEGYPVGTFWGYEASGLDADGKFILSAEKKDLGNVQPDFSMGLGMDFTYGNFDLGISGYGLFGQKVLNATNMMLYDPNRMAAYNVPDDFIGTGIKSPPTFSSYWIEDASFFRIQTLTVGYVIPLKSKISKLRVYMMGENLAVFTKYSGVDPEVNLSGLDNPGIDRFNNYPRPLTISFGVNFSITN
jgi:TonB-linked SusC/RagA family outer membrane protein